MNRGRVMLSCVAMLSFIPLVACKSDGDKSSMSSQAMSMLPESVKSSVNGYMSSLTDINNLLKGVTDSSSAAQAGSTLSTYTDRLSGYAKSLNSLSPETKKQISSAFGGQIESLNKTLTSQIARIKSNSTLNSLVGSYLDKIPTFKV